MKTLFRTAKERDADIMVTIDSDGQHDPEQIPIVLQPILNGECDVVIGSRFLNEEDRKKVPGYRSFGIRTITKLVRLTSHHNLTDGQSGFRAYSKVALSKIELAQEGMAVSTEILMRAGQKNLFIKEVPITIRYDIDGTSTHNPFTHGLSVVGSIIRFVSLRHPLAFYGIPGIAFLVLAGIFMTNTVDLFSQTRYISTNMIILSVGSAVMGVMLLVTGVILYSLAELLRERLRD